jgi:type II secretory ATPase GspE/PulE/Tfp pilus assembly ATPase PilB-like protein
MTGYRGRSGIHEVFAPSDRTRQMMLSRASSTEIRQAAVEEGMKTMQDDGLQKTLSGVTSMEECLRVVFIEG